MENNITSVEKMQTIKLDESKMILYCTPSGDSLLANDYVYFSWYENGDKIESRIHISQLKQIGNVRVKDFFPSNIADK